MSEETFEYECMRAELLGLQAPSFEEFEETRQLRQDIESEELETVQLRQIESEDELINSTHGKLDEINSILSITHQKLNKFKKTCGSLTSLLKFRSTPTGSASGSNENLAGNSINDALDTLEQMDEMTKEPNIQVVKKSSAKMQTKVNSQLDKLDSMLSKSEQASFAMEKQTKQMKKMLDK